MSKLSGKRVAVLATNGYEDSELTEPREALLQNGAEVDIVSIESGSISGKRGHNVDVTATTKDVSADDYDALVLPGGVINGDKIRLDAHAVEFTRNFFAQHKPVGAICHGGWILTDADVVRGRKLTSYPSLKTDLRNAGADWVDAEVVVDNGLVTSRTPEDLPAFNKKLVEEIGEGKHTGQTA
ncbi:MAG: type 1 glutamine amidotransferase domain-containing protein [Leucobacter sp.]